MLIVIDSRSIELLGLNQSLALFSMLAHDSPEATIPFGIQF